MKKTVKNSMAFILSGLMVVTGSAAASASVDTATAGNAERMTESLKDMSETGPDGRDDTFRVVLPAGTKDVFDFIMDPQELISKTEAAAYGDYVFEEDATLFFRRTDGEATEDYSSMSDSLVIANMGTAAVNIALTAAVAPESMGGITMTDDMDFTDDTDTSLYLALTDGNEVVPIDIEKGASIYTTLEGTSGEDGNYGTYWFQLIGAVNRNGDWSQLTEAAPRVKVTWSVSMGEEMRQKEDWEPEKSEAFMGSQNAGAGEMLREASKADEVPETGKIQEESGTAQTDETESETKENGQAGETESETKERGQPGEAESETKESGQDGKAEDEQDGETESRPSGTDESKDISEMSEEDKSETESGSALPVIGESREQKDTSRNEGGDENREHPETGSNKDQGEASAAGRSGEQN